MNTTVTTTPVTDLPVIDSPLDPEVADRLGNEMLLDVAGKEKPKRVGRTNRSWGATAPSSRAWTMGGRVD